MKNLTEDKAGRKPRRQYTKEFKLEAVRLTRQPGMGASKVARDLGISRSLLCLANGNRSQAFCTIRIVAASMPAKITGMLLRATA